jgi:selenocysteine lyase/cysteine desulfurase
MRHPDRRAFLRGAAVGAGLVAGDVMWAAPLRALAHSGAEREAGTADPRDAAGEASSPAGTEEYWIRLREEFLIPADRIYLNVGTLGVQPRIVVDAVIEHTARVAMSLPHGVQWDALKDACAALLGGDAAGFVFPRNTTEAMNFVANGLELGTGDEVVTTDHEHIGGLCCWQLIAARRGVRLRQVALPEAADEDGPIYDTIVAALGPATRVLSVSHVLFTNGALMPVAALAEACRRRGIIFVVDGAHPPGLMPVDIASLGCDFYATSPHKWLLAPQGTGLLWMGQEWRTRLWPTLASGGWDDTGLGAHRFNHMGSLDESRLGGLAAALAFHAAVGPDRIHARVAALREQIVERVRALPGATLKSPAESVFGRGMVSFTLAREGAHEVQNRLAAANVRIRVVGEGGREWIRLSPHIYTMPAEIDRVFDLIASRS